MAFERNAYLENGFLNKKMMKFSNSDIGRYVIPMEYEGRPDLVAFDIYGDISYQTFLTYFNSITDTPEGYQAGRVLKYVSKSLLE